MGAPGWTSFCKNGHAVETCGHHEIIMYPKETCDLCGGPVIGSCCEWGDEDYGEPEVPTTPIRIEKMKITREYQGVTKTWEHPVKIYDVSKLLNRSSEVE